MNAGITRLVEARDAQEIAAIYAPIVATTAISFEEIAPAAAEIRGRIVAQAETWPWLVADDGALLGYAYATGHRVRAAYRWSVDVSAYVHERARGRGVGRALYERLLALLAAQGFHRAYAGIALPNDPSLALHRAVGFAQIAVYHEVGFKHGAWHDVAWLERALARLVTPGEPIPVAALPPELLGPQPLAVRA
jgi:L-amino acid N-acyltransferase YncA